MVILSDVDNDIVGKSGYQDRGRFLVLENTNHGSYIVRKLDEPSAKKNKFMSEELYFLPPCILPCDPIDSPDLRYVNSSSLLIVRPLKNPLP